MERVGAELQQFRAFLRASDGIVQAATLQDKLTVIARGVVESGLFRRCLVSVYQHELTEAVMVGGQGVDAQEIARLRRQPALSRDDVRQLEAAGAPLGGRCYYIPARLLGARDGLVPSDLPREAFHDWHPDDMFLATLWSRAGHLFGFLTADDPTEGKVPTAHSVRTLALFASLASELLEREFALRRDALTQMYNGAFLDEILAELDRPPQPPFSALFADLDNLKTVNDRFGHRVGDQFILAAGRIVALAAGGRAMTFRPYGDEFIAICQEADSLAPAAERLEQALAVWNLGPRLGVLGGAPGDDQPQYRLAMCAGTADRQGAEPARAVVGRAEQSMYERKRIVHRGPPGRGRPRDAGPSGP